MADSDLCSTSQWIQFFRNAGLPMNVAANYALIFSDNRIQQNMLMDLSKEYLYDMGIKVMGDVIAILRYSKEFHNQLAKEKIIGGGGGSSAPMKASPASRMLRHYTRPVAVSPKTLIPENLPLPKAQKRTIFSLRKNDSTIADSGLMMKKVRRVPPEEEGAYNIKMPSGTTERSRKILEQQMQFTSKKSVFDRLGDSDVSSSTDVKRNMSSGSVFNRLGPSCTEVSTSTEVSNQGAPLSYRGVLKPTTSRKTIITTKPNLGSGSQQFVKIVGARPIQIPKPNVISLKPHSQVKRTVVNRLPGSRNVLQIESILQRNAQLNLQRRTQATIGAGFRSTGQNTSARVPAIRRLGLKSAGQGLQSRVSFIRKTNTSTIGQQQQKFGGLQGSVFKRLGR